MNKNYPQFLCNVLWYACVGRESRFSKSIRSNYILEQSEQKKLVSRQVTGMYWDVLRSGLQKLIRQIAKLGGSKCNYYVTNNERAWNQYIRLWVIKIRPIQINKCSTQKCFCLVQNFIEDGQLKLLRDRKKKLWSSYPVVRSQQYDIHHFDYVNTTQSYRKRGYKYSKWSFKNW
jgi:hypothetical protein